MKYLVQGFTKVNGWSALNVADSKRAAMCDTLDDALETIDSLVEVNGWDYDDLRVVGVGE